MSQMQAIGYSALGLGLGIALGVLFAPRSGADLRHEMRGKLQGSQEYLKAKLDQAGDYIDGQKRRLAGNRDRLTNAFEVGRQTYRQSQMAPTA